MNIDTVSNLSPQDLVARVRMLNAEGNRVLAALLLHLGEMEARELYTKHACSSMFAFCRRLGMSEGSTGRRLASARAVRQFPQLLPLIERGELHLTALAIVSGILTNENVDAVAASVRGKTQREVEEIRVRFAPRPVVKDSIRKLPDTVAPMAMPAPVPVPVEARVELESPPALAVVAAPEAGPSVASASGLAPAILELFAAGAQHPALATPSSRPTVTTAPVVRDAKPAAPIVPLQEDAYKVQLTASKALVAKIDHVKEMMRHRNPKGDLATIFDAALDLLIAKLEKERFGKTSRPRKVARPCKEGSVSQETRREVFERDGYQCTHVDEEGHRCAERGWLELDHRDPKALKGAGDAKNLRVRCRAHNRMHAKDVFGAEYIGRRIESARKKRAEGKNSTPPRPVHSTSGGESDGRAALSPRKP